MAPHLARERCQVPEGAGVDAALEIHHVVHRIPEVHPAPEVEFRLLGEVQLEVVFFARELQQVPDLLLADADQPVSAAHRTLRQAITKPARGHAEDGHVLGEQAGFSRSSRYLASSGVSSVLIPPWGNCQPSRGCVAPRTPCRRGA